MVGPMAGLFGLQAKGRTGLAEVGSLLSVGVRRRRRGSKRRGTRTTEAAVVTRGQRPLNGMATSEK